MDIINPATEELVLSIEDDNLSSISTKISRARVAQPLWAARTYEKRAEILKKFGEILVSHKERFAEDLTCEMGKPLAQAKGEISGVQARLDYFLEEIPKHLKPRLVHESLNMLEQVTLEPLGIIANISAWNYPYFVGANVFIPALLTGNAVLYKPSEFATITGMNITKCLHEAGVPEEVFAPIVGGGKVGELLLSQELDGVFFTGSHLTGKKIAAAVAPKMARLQLELGGKDPLYVCGDVDIEKAATNAAEGCFYNTGQSCCSVERVYVHQDIAEDFIKAYVTAVGQYKMGDPMDESVFIGPLTRESQLEILEGQIVDALEKGATLHLGGKRSLTQGYYFEPAVLTGVNQEMALMREESFGPVIGIMVVESDQAAVEAMNDTTYGLTAGVYCPDQDRAHEILEQLKAGSVYWNCCDRVSAKLPWTGWKNSGVGSTLGEEGICAFLQPKAWHLRKSL